MKKDEKGKLKEKNDGQSERYKEDDEIKDIKRMIK